MANKVQAKDISKKLLITMIDSVAHLSKGEGCTTEDIYELFDEYPRKVVRAKLHRLIKKDYLEGCACGCVSYLLVLGKGYEVMYTKPDLKERDDLQNSTC